MKKIGLFLASLFVAGTVNAETLDCTRVELSGGNNTRASRLGKNILLEVDQSEVIMQSAKGEQSLEHSKGGLSGFDGARYNLFVNGYFGPSRRGSLFVGEGKDQGKVVYIGVPVSSGTYLGSRGGGRADFVCESI